MKTVNSNLCAAIAGLCALNGITQGATPGMVLIPAGKFEMGDHFGYVDPKHESDETPIHAVRLDSFYIGINDVTTKEYCEFLNAALAQKLIEVRNGGVYLVGGSDLLCDTRASSPSSEVGWGGKTFSVLDKKENHPMVCVRWFGAVVYCDWLSAQENLPVCYDTKSWDCDFNKSGIRLPTEAEWEFAARGGAQNPYFNFPWGNDPDPKKANVPESDNPFRVVPRPTSPPPGYKAANGPPGQAWRVGARPLTTPVGFFNGKLQRKSDFNWPGDQETFQTSDGANGYGLYDMAGNVWQWCTEWYDRDYYSYSPSENPPGPAQGSPMQDGKAYRCIRGGSWFNGEFGHSRVSNRDPSFYRGPDPVTGLSDANGPWFHIGFRIVLPVNAENRPLIKPTPAQRVARQISGAGGAQRRFNAEVQPGGERQPRENQIGGGRGAGSIRLLPPRAEEQLNLTADQQKQLSDLAAEAQATLGKILTAEQQQQLQQLRPPQRQGENETVDRSPGENSDNRPARPDFQTQSSNDDREERRLNENMQNGNRLPPDQTPVVKSEFYLNNRPQTGSFALRSSAVTNGGALPKEFSGDGDGVSLPLEWSGEPDGTKSFVLIMHHTDARAENISYWILCNIPANVQSLPRDAKGVGLLGISSRGNHAGYTPPHSKGPGTRTYVFTLYALSSQLDFPASGVSQEKLLATMKDKILATSNLATTYTRYTISGSNEQPQENDRQPPPSDNREPRDGNQPSAPPHSDGRDRSDTREGRSSRTDNQFGGQRPGGGNGRVAENNKTPTSPNPGQTVGLFLNSPKACPGYTLLAPKHNTNTFLINNDGQIVHQWTSQYFPGQSVYLKPNGNLLHTCMMHNRSFTGGGEGGRIEEYDWNGKLIWEFWFSNDKQQQHHDIAPMPNGNILMLVVEKKSAAECIAAGFPPSMLRDRELYPDSIVEIQPVYPDGGKVVWEWHVWDHMIQDFNRTKANFGEVASHPELIYVGGGRGTPAFWNHVNSINYNPQLDQVSISARGNSEIWFIDHSTTMNEAASHAGGKHGKGGDLIYRWGNPASYKLGTERDAQLNQQHDGEWIPEGCPGAGHVTIFNNGYNRGYTSIEEIIPPLDAGGHYICEAGKPFGPEKTVWHYEAKNRPNFFSSEISGAHRLPNGNTLICAGVIGYLFEVTPSGETVWQYVNPAVRGGVLAQGEIPGKDVRGHLFNAVFKAHRYALDYPGFAGRDLSPKGAIELPASQKGRTGLDKADAQPGEHPTDVGGSQRPSQ